MIESFFFMVCPPPLWFLLIILRNMQFLTDLNKVRIIQNVLIRPEYLGVEARIAVDFSAVASLLLTFFLITRSWSYSGE